MALEQGVGIPVHVFATEQFVGTQEEAVVENLMALWEKDRSTWGQWFWVYPIVIGICLHVRLQCRLMEAVEQLDMLILALGDTDRRRLAGVFREFSSVAIMQRVQHHFRSAAEQLDPSTSRPPVLE